MIDHVGFAVSDAEKARAFCEATLAPIGVSLLMTITPDQTGTGVTWHGFGSEGKPFFWVGDKVREGEGPHVAFMAGARDEVDAFHAAGVKAGGRDNGAPGPRAHYGPDYYGAFMLDPDGNNIEAVYWAKT